MVLYIRRPIIRVKCTIWPGVANVDHFVNIDPEKKLFGKSCNEKSKSLRGKEEGRDWRKKDSEVKLEDQKHSRRDYRVNVKRMLKSLKNCEIVENVKKFYNYINSSIIIDL